MWNRGVLRSRRQARHTGVKDVNTRSLNSPGFSASQRGSRSGPSEVLRMIRSPYSYNLLFLKKTVMMAAPRSSTV